VTLAYPVQYEKSLPSVGFIAIEVNGLFGKAESAQVILIPATGKSIELTALPDDLGNNGIQTMHAALPRLLPGSYKIRVLLHDAAVRCALHQDDAYSLPTLVISDP